MFPFEQYNTQQKHKTSINENLSPINKDEGILSQIISKENQMKCKFHSQEEIHYFCFDFHCQRNLVCAECLLEGVHEHHEVEKIEKINNAWLEMLKTYEIKLKFQKDTFLLQQKKSEGIFQSIDYGFNHRKLEISQVFEAIFEKLKEKKCEILEFIEQEKSEIEIKHKEKQEKIENIIKLCNEGLEKISYSENLSNLSILDLSNNFSNLKEISKKIEGNQEFQTKMKESENNYRNIYDYWMSNLTIFPKIIAKSLNFTEKYDLNTININNINNKNDIKFYIGNSGKKKSSTENEFFDVLMKETVSFAADKSMKESFLNEKERKINEVSFVKRKIHNKFGQLLEVFKPGFARSKLSGYYSNNDEVIRKNDNFYQTPERKNKWQFDLSRSQENETNGNKYIFSLEKQQLKYVNSAQKLI